MGRLERAHPKIGLGRSLGGLVRTRFPDCIYGVYGHACVHKKLSFLPAYALQSEVRVAVRKKRRTFYNFCPNLASRYRASD